jgi:hypothetical protein
LTDDQRTRLRFFLAFFLIGLPAEIAVLSFSDQITAARCPPGTFLSGAVEPGMQLFGLLGLVMVLTFLSVRLLKHFPWFRTTDDEFYGNLTPWYVYPIAFAGLTALLVLGTLSRFCVMDSGILYNDLANNISQNYGWQDVKGVHTSCHWAHARNKGGYWRKEMFVIMADANNIDLMGAEADMPAIYPRIVIALSGHDFSFSSSIDPKCDYSHMDMLTQRP